ncbi:MAG TPA: hypothetical protein VF131_11960 [Blastocatellia bacterium]|nr:hypothetical protein [Blastocatellia bacterium]
MAKEDLTDAIAEFVYKSAPDLASRLESQAEALDEAKCINPVIGSWVDENDVKYLLSTFALNDKDFADRFPSMAHTTRAERQRVIAALEEHFEHCQHCSLKRGYDLELDARIKQACRQNSDRLLRLIGEEDSESSKEEDHPTINLEPAHP